MIATGAFSASCHILEGIKRRPGRPQAPVEGTTSDLYTLLLIIQPYQKPFNKLRSSSYTQVLTMQFTTIIAFAAMAMTAFGSPLSSNGELSSELQKRSYDVGHIPNHSPWFLRHIG